jgi:hypothetical protein
MLEVDGPVPSTPTGKKASLLFRRMRESNDLVFSILTLLIITALAAFFALWLPVLWPPPVPSP